MVMKLPAWLEGLMGESFFGICGVHENKRKNEKNIYCLDCCQSFCPHCLPTHHSHPLLQVRRYVYQDVVRLDDLEKLIDCSFVQVDHMVYQEEDLSTVLCRFDATDFAFSQFEGLQMDDDGHITSDSVLDDSMQFKDSSGSDSGMGISRISYKPEVERTKKKRNDFLPKFFSFGSRRKGAPQRSPLS
ncbi:Protein of unknown function DUF597 [Cynara cardunculus var. scolymus]|uniref:B box-type domain-containing protein n=1 Tax=Cynara cardunculus var. scolymus TaxID=59895 RepID=A0A103YG39_CYNCS|nr:Protein of unknown function DUF597 [Cynara cardunculus var. scolymus]